MTTITDKDIERSAALSSITLEGEQKEHLRHDLENIIGYIDQLSEVDTEGVEPTYAVHGLENVTRPDEIVDYGVSQEELMKNAPKASDDQFEVPKVLES